MVDAYVLLLPFALIGWLLIALVTLGWALNDKQMLIALDQWLGCCILPDSYADETISAWAHRTHRKRTEAFINWLFNDDLHCAKAYLSEIKHTQNPEEYMS
jgi:hypothetical protein